MKQYSRNIDKKRAIVMILYSVFYIGLIGVYQTLQRGLLEVILSFTIFIGLIVFIWMATVWLPGYKWRK